LKSFSTEPAFSWDYTTFCYWKLTEDDSWHEPPEQASVDTGALKILEILFSSAEGYHQFACEYYEQDFEVSTLRQFFDHCPLNPALLTSLNSDNSMDDIRDELVQIGYPTE